MEKYLLPLFEASPHQDSEDETKIEKIFHDGFELFCRFRNYESVCKCRLWNNETRYDCFNHVLTI